MAIGVDWGGTTIKAAVVDGANAGVILERDTKPHSALADIAAMILELGGGAAGIAIPGEVRQDGRCWRLPNVPGFDNVNIAAEISRATGAAVAVENDATAAALAERLFGWGNTYRSFLLVTLGTGVGGGVVLDGHVRRGAGGFAGEIGHVIVDTSPDAWPCGCGRLGCMEAYAGKAGLLRRFGQMGGAATEVRQIAELGYDAANEVWKQLGWALGTGLAQINNVLDLDALVFTGGVSGSFALFEKHLREAMRARVFAPPLAELPLLVSRLDGHAGLIGAAHLPTQNPPSAVQVKV
jgi:glucokinase